MNIPNDKKKGVAILESTSELGEKCLAMIEAQQSDCSIEILTSYQSADLLIQQAKKHKPSTVIIVNETHYEKVKEALWEDDIYVYTGEDSLAQVVAYNNIDIVVADIQGMDALKPITQAIVNHKRIILANIDILALAGDLITQLALENKAEIFTLNAKLMGVFQCLAGEYHNKIEKVYLPTNTNDLNGIKAAKELFAAQHLFNLRKDQIELLIHEEGVVQALVEFEEGSIKSQMSFFDLQSTLSYAFNYPVRLKSNGNKLSFKDFSQLSFQQVSIPTTKSVALAYQVMEQKGLAPAAMLLTYEQLKARKEANIFEEMEKKSASFSQNSKPSIEDYLQLEEQLKNS